MTTFADGSRNARIVGSRSVATPCLSGLVPSPRKIVQPVGPLGPRHAQRLDQRDASRSFRPLQHHIQLRDARARGVIIVLRGKSPRLRSPPPDPKLRWRVSSGRFPARSGIHLITQGAAKAQCVAARETHSLRLQLALARRERLVFHPCSTAGRERRRRPKDRMVHP
jgi:hypothetical protein